MSEAASPLLRAVQQYRQKGLARFHMPGHKGVAPSFLGDGLGYDITEVAGADSLYEASGPIAETEARYAALYGTAASLLSAGGATLCIQAMLALAAAPGDSILCARGVHAAAVHAMALLDLRPVWVYPDTDPVTGLALPLTVAQLADAWAAAPDAKALYLTSPDYFGVTCDIGAISSFCRARGLPLLVDNAHGAHLRFLRPDRHPISLGADLCCDSLHKTLPVLTGGALLQIGNPRYAADAKGKMSLFGSTSPSYLILLSADEALPYLEGPAAGDLERTAAQIRALEELCRRKGLLLPVGKADPIRLSLGYGPSGLSPDAFAAHLAGYGVEPEYRAAQFCVFLAGAHNTPADFARLREAVETLPVQSAPSPPPPDPLPRPEAARSLRDALFAPCETVSWEKAAGRICAGFVSPCPPGIPLAVPGEILGQKLCDALKKSGIQSVNVIK